MIDAIALRAEDVRQRGREWFGDSLEPPAIVVYLVDWVDDVSKPGWASVAGALVAADRDVVWLLASPETPALGLERAVLEILVRANLGAVPQRIGRLLVALAAMTASEHGIGINLDEADRQLDARRVRAAADAQLFSGSDSASINVADPSELSFLFYLQRTFGRAALARFVRGCLTDDAAVAASAAYSRPLEALEHDWLAALRARRRAETSAQDILRRALPLLRPYWVRVVELFAYMGFDLLFTLSIPLSTKYLIDDIIATRDTTRLAIWLVVVPTIFLVGSVASYRRALVAGLIGESVLRDLRQLAFAHLQRLSLLFYARSSTGDLLARLTSDMDAVQEALGDTLPQLVFQVVTLVVASALLLLLNWPLGLLVLVLGVPVFAVVYTRASERLRTASRDLQDQIGSMVGIAQENVSGQLVVKSFSLERRAIAQFDQILALMFQGSMRLITIGAFLTGSTTMVFLGVRVVVLVVGALLTLNGQMTVGELVAFVGLIGEVLSPVMSLSGLYRQLQQTTGAFDRVQELLAEVPAVVEDPQAVIMPALRRGIRFEDVTFRYDDGEDVLRGVTLDIPAGSRVAIVGPSGAGKSTLAALLLRLYDPNGGRILFDGQDIREATLVSVRRQLAVVPQDTYLFNATVRENIAIGREDATDADVEDAATAAALHEVILRTQAGYQTEIGERGTRLSGGQRQRLAIARALIRDPRVLILDEATSALDSETEAAILQTLDEASRGRTTIMITHRLEAARMCDTVFVLEHGRLVEQGSHDELCQLGGLYWRLYSEGQGGAPRGVDPISSSSVAAGRPTVNDHAAPASAILIARRGVEPGRVYALNRDSLTIGRTEQNDISFASNAVSRRHCRIEWAHDHYRLEDLGSTNGTRVNGARVQSAELDRGDLIEVADQLLEFSLTPDPRS